MKTSVLREGRKGRGPALLFGLLLLLAPATAQAVKVRGELSGTQALVSPTWVRAKDPASRSYTFREPVATVPAKHRKLRAYLPKEVAVAVLAETPQPPQKMTVVIAGGRMAPSTIVVPPGTQITFKNGDPFPHSLHAADKKSLRASPTQAGGTRQWTVPAEGVYEIRDGRSPSARLWVVSEPRAAVMTTPAANGRFALDVTEMGGYELRAYFAGKPVGEVVPVEVAYRDIDLRRKPLDVSKKAPKAAPRKAPKQD